MGKRLMSIIVTVAAMLMAAPAVYGQSDNGSYKFE